MVALPCKTMWFQNMVPMTHCAKVTGTEVSYLSAIQSASATFLVLIEWFNEEWWYNSGKCFSPQYVLDCFAKVPGFTVFVWFVV